MQNTQTDDAQNDAQQQDPSAVVPVSDNGDQAVQMTSAVQGTPDTAEDTDLIEKEWVQKAKEIVEGTRGDPHAQSQQIQHVRADYIKKRYDRDVQAE